MKVLAVASYSDRAEAATFIGLREAGVDVHVMCEPEARAMEWYRAAGVPVEPLAIRRAYDPAAIRGIRRRLREFEPDVLHLLTRRTVRNALVAAIGLDVRIVAYRGVAGGVRPWNPASWLTFLHPRVDRIVCVSEHVRRDLLGTGRGGPGVPERRLVTIHKGHDVSWYDGADADLDEHGVPPGSFVVGCLANLRPGKGIEYLVRAAALVDPALDVHFLLVGRGMDGPAVAEMIRESSRPASFHVLGHRADGPDLMAACDVMVLPSLSEGLSRVVIEAMANRTPPVVTPAGGGELVEDGRSGLVVPPADPGAIARAIERLARDPAERERLGAAARERIRRDFSVAETIRRTRSLYEELVRSA